MSAEVKPARVWSEKKGRIMMALAALAILVGTILLSVTVLSVHVEQQTIVIEPHSYRAFRFAIYGFGQLEYSESTSLADWGSQIYLLELDRNNYERFVAGKSYNYTGYETIGGGGTGSSMVAGPIWELYLVFVNDGSTSTSIEFKADATAYFSLLAAGPLTAVVTIVAYATQRWFKMGDQIEMKPPFDRTRREQKKAIAAIAGLVILPFAIMKILDFALSRSIPSWVGLGIISFEVGVLASIATVFLLRFRLHTVQGEPEAVLADLAHRLRISNYRVSEKPGHLWVQISPSVATKIRARQTSEGTAITYQADATPSRWSTIVILLLLAYASPISLALSFVNLYKSAAFASERVLPRLSQLPISMPGVETDTRALLIDSLSEGRRLSAEAYEATKSNYDDGIIVLGLMGALLLAVLTLVSWFYLPSDSSGQDRGTVSLLIGFAGAAAFTVLAWRWLMARMKPRIQELRSWAARLEAALSREVTSSKPPQDEPSSFELVAESYREIPKWLHARRKGGMYREPGDWVLIFLFSYIAFILGFAGIVTLLQSISSVAVILVALALLFGGLASALYMRWRKRQTDEAEGTFGDWSMRLDALRDKMETYLRNV
jgi:hypothetical protein